MNTLMIVELVVMGVGFLIWCAFDWCRLRNRKYPASTMLRATRALAGTGAACIAFLVFTLGFSVGHQRGLAGETVAAES